MKEPHHPYGFQKLTNHIKNLGLRRGLYFCVLSVSVFCICVCFFLQDIVIVFLFIQQKIPETKKKQHLCVNQVLINLEL